MSKTSFELHELRTEPRATANSVTTGTEVGGQLDWIFRC